MFQPVKAQRVSDEILRQIRDVLLSGKLRAGDRLPTERQLAEQFGTSRASVREALRGLEQEGVIYIKKGVSGGVFVAAVDHQLVSRPLETLLRLKKVSMAHVAEARKVFEPEAARLAAERATAEDLQEIEAVIEQMVDAVRRGKTFVSYDLMFHKLVARAARNPILELMADAMLDVASRAITELRPSVDMLKHVAEFHVRIYRAIRERNPQQAQKVMLEHIVDVQHRLAEREEKKKRAKAEEKTSVASTTT